MSITNQKEQVVEAGANDKRFFRIRKNSDVYFSLEDARECINRIKENAEQEQSEQIIEQKKDILAHQNVAPMQQKVGVASIADIFGFDPTVSKQKSVGDKSPDEVPAQYRKYYKLLLKLKETVKNDLAKLTNTNLAITVGAAKSEASDPDVESFDSEFAISLMSSEQEALTEIEEAIRRIHNGTYGICEATGAPIEPERLLAVPFARYSIEGQKAREKSKTVEVQRGGVFHDDTSDADFVAEDE